MSFLESQIRDCQSSIQENNSKIKHYEQLHDSLVRFKSDVSGSQGQFSSVNNTKKSLVKTLDGYSQDCKTAKEYSNGMNKVLNGVGITYVNCTFSALLFTIGLKLAEYKGKIHVLEAKNTALRAAIDTLNDQIRQEASANE